MQEKDISFFRIIGDSDVLHQFLIVECASLDAVRHRTDSGGIGAQEPPSAASAALTVGMSCSAETCTPSTANVGVALTPAWIED